MNIKIKLSKKYGSKDTGSFVFCDEKRAEWLIENDYSIDHPADPLIDSIDLEKDKLHNLDNIDLDHQMIKKKSFSKSSKPKKREITNNG